MTNTLPIKEVEVVKKEMLVVQKMANDFQINNDNDLAQSADILKKVSDGEKLLTARKEEITRPLMQSLSSIRDLFKPLELGFADAKKMLKSKVVAYQLEQEEKAEKEKARIAARVEKGTMRADTAAGKIEAIVEPKKSVSGNVGKISTRILVKVRIIDETSIPREYMVPDMAKITEAVLKQNIEIPGVEKYEEKSIAIR